MLRFILGGVALAVTGYGVKKYFEDESNCQKFEDSVCGLIDKAEEKTEKFFDFASNAIYKTDKESEDLSNNSIEVDDSIQDKEISKVKSWNKTSDWI